MKKIVTLIVFLGFSIFISGCESIDYDTLFSFTSSQIEAEIPEVINADFELPVFENIGVTYELNGKTFIGEYIYESPFYDQDVTLNYTLVKNNQTRDYSVDVRLLSDDSGYNEYRIYITLPQPIDAINKETYMQASVVTGMNKNGLDVIETETDAAQIRGRGNSTWIVYPKKPYRLRFDEDTSIFGMPKANNYVLLAEYADKSLMRNTIVQKMGSLCDTLAYSLETRFVELYINNVYNGLYVLTEQVEFQKNKLDIESIAGTANTGYLMELDMRFFDQMIVPGFDWIVVSGSPYEIKEPKSDDPLYSNIHAQYMFDYITSVEEALTNDFGYESLIDVDAWIDFFIIHELTKNVDVGFSSVYLIKEKDGLLKPGPLWDFDFSLGNADYIDYGPENFYGMKDYKNHLFQLMMNLPEIRLEYRERFNDMFFDELPMIYDMIPVLSESIATKADRNFEKWDIMETYIWPNPYEVMAESTFLGQVSYVEEYLHLRSDWMYETMLEYNYEHGIFD